MSQLGHAGDVFGLPFSRYCFNLESFELGVPVIHMLNATAHKYKYTVEGIYNLSITIDRLKFILIDFDYLLIEITEANLR